MGKILHKRTSGDTNTESAQSVLQSMKYGEVAVSYGKGNECLIFKNSINSLNKIMSDSFNKAKYISHNNSNFKRFETKNDFQMAFDAGEIVYPCVSYIVETNEYHYMTPPVDGNEFHFKVEADYAEEYFWHLSSVMGQNMWEFIVEATGELWLTSYSKFFSSFIVNGEEMIDQAVTSIPEVGLSDDAGLSIIKVPFEEGKVWNITVKFPEDGLIMTDDEFERFFDGYAFIYTPISEVNYNETLLSLNIQSPVFTGICPFILGIYALGPQKMMFTGDLPQYENLDCFKMLALYNGMYVRALILGSGESLSLPIMDIYIPSGNSTYGNPDDVWDGNSETGLTYYGVLNYFLHSFGDGTTNNLNIHIIEY